MNTRVLERFLGHVFCNVLELILMKRPIIVYQTILKHLLSVMCDFSFL